MKPARVDLSLAQLQAFVHIVAAGSFRAAALQMGVSQPALSRAIRQAESVLGARLFDRDTRNLQITTVGRELLPIAQRVLREFDASFGELGQFLQGRTGKVAVATLPSTGASLLAQAVASRLAATLTSPRISHTPTKETMPSTTATCMPAQIRTSISSSERLATVIALMRTSHGCARAPRPSTPAAGT